MDFIKLGHFFRTSTRYCFIISSFTSYSRVDCPTTNWESDRMQSFLAPAALAKSIPAHTASYSATLLVTLNPNLRACLVISHSGDLRTTPAPPPTSLDAPSTLTSQHL